MATKLAARFGNFVQWFKSKTAKAPKKLTPVAVGAEGGNDGGLLVEEAPIDGALPVKKAVKETPLEKLQRGYEEMINLMGSVRVHLEKQSERSEKLISILDGLPEALKSLPEATRNQTRTLDAIQTNLTQQVQHNAKLADALNGLAKSTQHHEHAMSAIGQQLDAGHQRSEQILGSFNTLSGTLERMGDTNEASTVLLRRMAEQESVAAEQVRQLFVRNQKQMTTMSVVSWSLALVALTVAGYVAVSVSKMNGQTAAAPTPAVTTPVNNTSPSPTPTPAPAPGTTVPASTELTPAITPAAVKPVETPSKTSLLDDMPLDFTPATSTADAGQAIEAGE